MRALLTLILLGTAAQASAQAPRTATAVRAAGEVRLDGRLDEAAWADAPEASGFASVDPGLGAPAGLDTRIRILFDERSLYVAAVMRDTTGRAGVRVQDLRRDFDYYGNDLFGIALDAVGDGRFAVAFQVTPAGTLRDLQVRDGVDYNRDWAGVWDARTTVSDSGWTAEIAIPWSTLRYPPGAGRTWGVQFVRTIRRASEITGWSPWPVAETPYHMQRAGRLVGLVPPPPARNLTVQPYALTRAARAGDAPFSDGLSVQLGGDLKWAVRPQTVLDLTVNTDFAQADADQQVVNLDRFSVFFPERRAFFLESADVFQSGTDAVTPFYSRRIGLDQGLPVGLDAGGRLVTAGAWGQAGALAVRQRGTAVTPAATFAIARASRNAGAAARVSALGAYRRDDAIAASGTAAGTPAVDNLAVSADAYVPLTPTLRLTAMASGTATRGDTSAVAGGEGYAQTLWVRSETGLGYVGFLHDLATSGYAPRSGFVYRTDVVYNSPAVTLNLRPRWRPRGVRAFSPGAFGDALHRLSDGALLEAQLRATPLSVEFDSGASASAFVRARWQNLDAAEAAFFRPLGVALAPGRYRNARVGAAASTDLSRRLGFSGSVETGGYFDGRLTEVEATAVVAPSPRAALRVRYALNRATGLGVAAETAVSHLVGPELRLALSPRLQGTVFWQYNTLADLAAWNVRLSWEFRPLSTVFVVLNDNRFYVPTAVRQADPAQYDPQQQAVVKVSYLRQL